jgi:Fe-S-cluster containining protein
MKYPFGIDPTEEDIASAVEQGQKIYEGCPETTCCSKNECCNAGCPNLYFTEFLNIRRGAVDKMPPEQRINLTIECVKRYLQDQRKSKPCVFLGKDRLCTIYPYRHFKCRTYGLIPPSLYDWIANSVSKEMGVDRSEVPLCNQCTDVKIKPEFKDKFPDGIIPEKTIRDMENHFRVLDRTLGLSKKLQDEGFGFLTYHDWHLLFEFGPEWMETLTQFRLKWTDEQKEKFISELKTALEVAFSKTNDSKQEGQK